MVRVPVLALMVVIMSAFPGGETTGWASPDDPETFFELKIRPVLAESCFKCHGGEKTSSGFRVDSRDALLEGGYSGPAILPGDPDESLLIQAIRHTHEDIHMPPTKPLPDEVVADFTTWVAAGAIWPEATTDDPAQVFEARGHWAFEPVRTVEPPSDPSGWSASPIDQFIAARHRALGLRPAPAADKPTLIRRASFDLIGLPPSPEQIEAFVADERPDAFARVVDELLASPHYGERWGRYWLDLARYADTAGDNSDYPIPEAYLYRDWVIDAFNADKPYDQFLHEQLAGDILAQNHSREDYAAPVIATGFIAQAKRFGTFKLEDMHLIIEDTLQTVGQVVLGLSLRCARCHDHKYDPVTMEDYYALYGFFASTGYPFAGAEELRRPSDFAPLIPPDEFDALEAAHAETIAGIQSEIEQVERHSDLGRRVHDLEREIASIEERLPQVESRSREDLEQRLALRKAEQAEAQTQLSERLAPLREQLEAAENNGPMTQIPLAYAVREIDPVDVPIQINGNPRETGEIARRGVPKFLDPDTELTIPEGSSGRLELARWLTRPDHPLTARVMVNRIWQHHFGKPIVPTPSDFGMRGLPPTHPELLDWLARDFVENGWSIKAMHRRIMLSQTYQLASTHDPENAAIDAGNTNYWRFDRRRLDAEALRDTILALGGNLDRSRPGPHPFPPKDRWRFTAHHQFKAVYPSNHRSVYLMVQRLHPHPYLALFNGPDTSASTPIRDSATVPLQVLYLLNSDFVHEQARDFAWALIHEEPDPGPRVRVAYQTVFARPPAEADQARALSYLQRYAECLDQDGVPPDQRELESWTSLARVLLASNEFLYVD